MRNMRSVQFGVLACVAVAFATGCVTIAEHRNLQRRVHVIENGGRGGGGGAGMESSRVADIGARLEALGREIDGLGGRLEETEHKVDRALEEARAARHEAANGGSTQGTPAQLPPDGAAAAGAAVNSAELDAYRDARSAWSDGDPDTCIDRFRNFLQTYPSSSYAENASYWMADCFYKRGDFKTAVLRFDDVVARYPKGTRAPDALYRQGEALLRLGPGYGKAAGKAFERVVQEYPDSARATEAQKQLALLRSG